ncbi:cytochrome C oxidase subunit II [Paenibacillus psychroresistens]|uniref:Cytochrome C oxidase subunit II n=1 Tax=Paenibacillus psychroresistens TaxID=1778678 RepID=A0A6B8RNS1_9BACL|nr:cupredoxin domain-containing protein [Paenibacillus psychroresistens]QGQ97980.1 cytochrome C oxidase subunit II [Paenibacillus psychroresistens]
MKKLLSLLLVLTLVFALSACGSKKDDAADAIVDPAEAVGTTEASTELIFKASKETFKFDKEEYTIKKGETIKLTLVNESGTHALRIDKLKVNLKEGKMSQIITPDEAGTYTISCSFPCGGGHMNMKAKLIVV